MTDDEFAPLVQGARALGLELTAEQVALFARFRCELLDWNQRVNLTAIVDPALVLTRHFLDALTVVLTVPVQQRARPLCVVDVGAGAGLPGLALKIVLPQWQMTELDSVGKKTRFVFSVGKKTRFVAHVAHVLGLQGVTVLTGRAEDLAREREHRERYDLCLARGVAPLRVLAEYALPFCAVGALAVAMKKGDLAREIEEGRRAVGQAGGRVEPLVPVPALPGLDGARVLVPCRKVRPTPPHLPRAAGVPAKRPL